MLSLLKPYNLILQDRCNLFQNLYIHINRWQRSMGWPNQPFYPSSMTQVHPGHYQSPDSINYPTVYNTIQGPQRVAPKSTRPLPATTVKPNAEATTSHDLLEPDRSSIRPEKLKNEAVTDFRVFQAQQRPDHTFNFRQLFPVIHFPWYPIQEQQNYDEGNQVVASAIGKATATEAGAPNVIDIGDSDVTGMSFTGTTLLLEPSAKAVSGNGGTSISAPISRAILRKNSGTRVIFRPQSVAIAGVGGTAHAQADLILDYVE